MLKDPDSQTDEMTAMEIGLADAGTVSEGS